MTPTRAAWLSRLLLVVCLGLAAARQVLATQVITLEAENGILLGTSLSTGVRGFSGTGYVTGFRSATNTVRWSFPAAAGAYHLLIRYRSPNGQKTFAGTLNGVGISGVLPRNAKFETFDAGSYTLLSGTNTLEIGGGSNYYEIDCAQLVYFPGPLPVPATLADPHATEAARLLMQKLVEDYGKRTWSGQHEALDLPYVEKVTERQPLIVEGDLLNYTPSRVAHGSFPTNYTENLIGLQKSGHVLGLLWHWNAPAHLLDTKEQPWWFGFYTQASTFDIASTLADTNSPDYALLLRDIDTIAVQLKKLAAANIPVLWRPLHEPEGGWFWWGAKGPEAYKQLWRLLFNRLTGYHGLHNLIWVLASEDPQWYPGDDVVDVIGVDAYPKDRATTLRPEWESLKSRFDGKKLIALTEFGGVPEIERMQSFGVWWAWFSSWTGQFTPSGPSSSPVEVVLRTYHSPNVLTLPGQ